MEIRRVISSHGRIAIFTLTSEMKGTIAAPEPMASRIHFYTDKELTEMAKKAGFVKTRIERPDLEFFAREAKLPEDVVAVAGRIFPVRLHPSRIRVGAATLCVDDDDVIADADE